MIAETVRWVGGTDGVLEMIDQRRLPTEFVILKVRSIEQLHEAIRTLAVRGAPAIGVAAAYGPVLALQWHAGRRSFPEALEHVLKACDYLATSRPTAVNLFWALDRIRAKAKEVASDPQAAASQLAESILVEANAICAEDIEMCRQIGANGEQFIRDGFGVLTHCNAGALATAGQGTALSVMFEAQKKGRRFEVYADETRPLLQGARLTAWELQRAGIKVTVICDNMAGFLMKQGRIQAVITGADRIAANGDTANKIGTYSVSVLAKHHGIPFYIAAPSSTFDLTLVSGDQIPIEERNASEVTWIGDKHVAPEDVGVYNPAFDVTPAQNIAAIITEKGVIQNPNEDRIRDLLG
ncbi:MAG TPA: S-methyl-5-thioribose-1-phosphate isomerase [Sedimentisphaerales bacterium]|jgi:methylthioribose-1-phosphate isomerase|nr:S-methyl-5-thioribose-1-phosphate isomerase [Sedimentisphaerales bacterium]HNU28705.1 S-methyl-5-thioribose-1-phosphate isomerase [Sedimentisphaerales bacterium]